MRFYHTISYKNALLPGVSEIVHMFSFNKIWALLITIGHKVDTKLTHIIISFYVGVDISLSSIIYCSISFLSLSICGLSDSLSSLFFIISKTLIIGKTTAAGPSRVVIIETTDLK